MSIKARHAGHGHGNHYANIKYGYITLAVSAAFMVYLIATRFLFIKRWKSQARTPSGVLRFLSEGSLTLRVLIWTILVVGILFANVSNLGTSYTVVLKRLGRVGYCLVPLDVVLAIRPTFLGPHSLYLQYLGLHKWLLRLIILATTVHGVGYSIKWLIEKRFWNRTFAWRNFLGVIPFWMSLLLIVVSLRPLRRKLYGLFYIWHNITVFAFTAFMLWHARPGVTDVLVFIFFLYGVQIFLRIRLTHRVEKLTLVDPEDSQLRLVKLQKPANFPVDWVPGSHLRMSWRLTNWRYWVYPTHPYSISTLPGDTTVDLVIKKGFRFEIFLSLEYSISSPYNLFPPQLFQTADNVHVICGGSGISLGVPVFRYLKQNSSVITKMTWVVRSIKDTYVLPELGVQHSVDVYVTQGNLDNTLFFNTGDEEDYGLLNLDGKDMELESLNLDDDEPTNPFTDEAGTLALRAINYHKGRPILHEVFSHLGETDDPRNKWIVVCGPAPLISAVKKWGKLNKTNVFEELYDM